MKKKILSLIGATAIIALMVFNIQFTNNAISGNSILSSFVVQASAYVEGNCDDLKSAGICKTNISRHCIGNDGGVPFDCTDTYSS